MTLTLRAKSPGDLLAAVPVALGFEPRDSIVMLTFGGATAFHARIDLPPRGDVAALASVTAALLEPCRRHRARRVVFVLYDADARRARQVARRLGRDFEHAGISVLECLRADAGRWYSADGSRAGVPEHGVPYDTSTHPFRAQAVVEGHVTLDSRAELAASIAPDPEAVAAVEAVRSTASPLSGPELAQLCARHAQQGTTPTPEEAAGILLSVQVGPLRDAAWAVLTRPMARRHVTLWRDLVRRAPDDLMPAAAAVLGFAAWLQGDGALAWCALDRCFELAPLHSLGGLVAHLLEAAIAPGEWERMRASMTAALGEAG
jgi:hypothetical protein